MKSRLNEKVQIEHMRLMAATHRFQVKADIAKAGMKYAVIFGCAWVGMRSLVDLGSMDKGALAALAGVVKALRLGEWIGYIAGGGGLVAWQYERAGKKRAIRALGELRQEKEASDPDRAGSGLDVFGNTPKS
jgi:hypothetical protein